MKTCLMCDEPIEAACFRIRIGGVEYDELHGGIFMQTPDDTFRDGTQTKWLCRRCAENAQLYIDELEFDACRAPEGSTICGCTFEPMSSDVSESVLLIEWGQMAPSTKGPGETFVAEVGGHVHYNCACDGWRLPLFSIEPQDCP